IEAGIDGPVWWHEHDDLVAAKSPSLDLSAECVGTGPNPRESAGFTIQVEGVEQSEIVERHGITGLALGQETQIRLAVPGAVVDVGLAQFGEPPTVTAYAGAKAVAKEAPDAVQRQ